MPEKVGETSKVKSSSVCLPVSEPAVKSGSEGGTISVSIVIRTASEFGLEIPISLIAVAYMRCSPSESSLTTTIQVPSYSSAKQAPISISFPRHSLI